MKRTVASFALFLLVACGQEVHTGSEDVNVAPSKVYERCFDLEPGREFAYGFKANGSLRFNLHYHEGKEVVYGVPERLAADANGVYEPEREAEYCLMWTNANPRIIKLAYDYTIR